MSDDRYERTTHDGKTVDRYTDYNLHLAEERLGYPLTIVQGSYHPGVGASAGTHDGGGVVDLAPWDWQSKVRVLRELGFAAWHRPARRGVWPEHIHAVLIGNTKLAPLAKQQVSAYRNGRDGLAGNGRDTFWRPAVIKNAAYKGAPPPPVVDPIEWAKWKVTLPIGKKGKPTETSSDIPHRPWYGRDTEDRNWLVFRANCGGVTTSNSGYPRSELRELSNGKLAAWDSRKGTHALAGRFRVTHLPKKKPHVCVMQAHDKESDAFEVRLEGKRLFVEVDGDEVGLLDANYRLGDVFALTATATKTGISIRYVGASHSATVTHRQSGSGWYWRAGAYCQSNTSKGDKPDAYAEVAVAGLRVSHS